MFGYESLKARARIAFDPELRGLQLRKIVSMWLRNCQPRAERRAFTGIPGAAIYALLKTDA
jgi:hypothetical protein